MASIERYKELKAKVDRLRREHDRAEGALEQAMVKLQKQYGCGTLEEGKILLAKTEKDCHRKRSKFDKAMERFENDMKQGRYKPGFSFDSMEGWGEKLGK